MSLEELEDGSLSIEECLQLFQVIETAVAATIKSLDSLTEK